MKIINDITKIFLILICTYILILKLINCKSDKMKNILVAITSVLCAILYVFLKQYIDLLVILIVMGLLYGMVIAKILNFKYLYSTIITLISEALVFLLYTISIIVSSIILKILMSNIESENIMILFLAITIELLLIHFFFKIKRFKNGFSFLKDQEKINNIGIVGVLLISIAILIYSIIGTYNNYILVLCLFSVVIVELIFIIIWIRRKITGFYKTKLKEQTVEDLTNEIKEKDEIITNITEENKALAIINHKYSSRIRALENFTSKIAVKPELVEKFSTEFGVDFTDINEQITSLSKEFSDEINKNIKINNELPKTGIFGIDNLLEYLNSESIKNNINFNMKINGNINEMIENVIPQNKLETLLGDHIKDAIIAINFSEGTNKEILLEIGNNDISIYDTGIEFEIYTLLKLGNEQVTTHKLTGGSGIGFMTTFETLKECKASLEIEEMKDNKYTKAVKVMFDGLNEYRIKSYRAEDIRRQDTDERIKIVE